MKSAINGIETLYKQGRTLDRDGLGRMRNHLIDLIPMPKVEPIGETTVKMGARVSVSAKGLRFHALDFFAGKVSARNLEDTGQPLVLSFPGAQHPHLVTAAFDPKQQTLSFEVPHGALDGEIRLLVPIEETYGPLGIVKKVFGADKALLDEVLALRGCKAAEGMYEARSLETLPSPRDDPRGFMEFLRRRTYHCYTVTHRYEIVCDQCTVECSHGAIEFDEAGRCSINPEICKGSYYWVDRRQLVPADPANPADGRLVFERVDEQSCWECFRDDETYSSKCQQQKLRKSLHLDTNCCLVCKEH